MNMMMIHSLLNIIHSYLRKSSLIDSVLKLNDFIVRKRLSRIQGLFMNDVITFSPLLTQEYQNQC